MTLGFWEFIASVWGFFTPMLIELLMKKIKGGLKLFLVILFCFLSGLIATAIKNNGLIINMKDIGEVLKYGSIILGASQISWTTTWYSVFNQEE